MSENPSDDGAAVVLALTGELDVASAAPVMEALRRNLQAGHHVIVDLGEVSFIDSTGLAAIVKGPETAEQRALLVLRHSRHSQPQRLLALTNVSEVFTFEPEA